MPVQLSPDRLDPVSAAGAAMPRRNDTPGTELELLVLVVEAFSCAGIDLASGALVRAWSPEPVDPDLRPYDVVAATLEHGHSDLLPDPSQPEAVLLAGAPETIGRLTGRRAERFIRQLVHPVGQPLLGLHGPAVPFWERTKDHPSIAVVEPEGRTIMTWRGARLVCLFGWRGTRVELPFTDRRVAAALARTGRRMAAGRGERLVVALAPPAGGHCHKVVAALLPRP